MPKIGVFYKRSESEVQSNALMPARYISSRERVALYLAKKLKQNKKCGHKDPAKVKGSIYKRHEGMVVVKTEKIRDEDPTSSDSDQNTEPGSSSDTSADSDSTIPAGDYASRRRRQRRNFKVEEHVDTEDETASVKTVRSLPHHIITKTKPLNGTIFLRGLRGTKMQPKVGSSGWSGGTNHKILPKPFHKIKTEVSEGPSHVTNSCNLSYENKTEKINESSTRSCEIETEKSGNVAKHAITNDVGGKGIHALPMNKRPPESINYMQNAKKVKRKLFSDFSQTVNLEKADTDNSTRATELVAMGLPNTTSVASSNSYIKIFKPNAQSNNEIRNDNKDRIKGFENNHAESKITAGGFHKFALNTSVKPVAEKETLSVKFPVVSNQTLPINNCLQNKSTVVVNFSNKYDVIRKIVKLSSSDSSRVEELNKNLIQKSKFHTDSSVEIIKIVKKTSPTKPHPDTTATNRNSAERVRSPNANKLIVAENSALQNASTNAKSNPIAPTKSVVPIRPVNSKNNEIVPEKSVVSNGSVNSKTKVLIENSTFQVGPTNLKSNQIVPRKTAIIVPKNRIVGDKSALPNGSVFVEKTATPMESINARNNGNDIEKYNLPIESMIAKVNRIFKGNDTVQIKSSEKEKIQTTSENNMQIETAKKESKQMTPECDTTTQVESAQEESSKMVFKKGTKQIESAVKEIESKNYTFQTRSSAEGNNQTGSTNCALQHASTSREESFRKSCSSTMHSTYSKPRDANSELVGEVRIKSPEKGKIQTISENNMQIENVQKESDQMTSGCDTMQVEYAQETSSEIAVKVMESENAFQTRPSAEGNNQPESMNITLPSPHNGSSFHANVIHPAVVENSALQVGSTNAKSNQIVPEKSAMVSSNRNRIVGEKSALPNGSAVTEKTAFQTRSSAERNNQTESTNTSLQHVSTSHEGVRKSNSPTINYTHSKPRDANSELAEEREGEYSSSLLKYFHLNTKIDKNDVLECLNYINSTYCRNESFSLFGNLDNEGVSDRQKDINSNLQVTQKNESSALADTASTPLNPKDSEKECSEYSNVPSISVTPVDELNKTHLEGVDSTPALCSSDFKGVSPSKSVLNNKVMNNSLPVSGELKEGGTENEARKASQYSSARQRDGDFSTLSTTKSDVTNSPVLCNEMQLTPVELALPARCNDSKRNENTYTPPSSVLTKVEVTSLASVDKMKEAIKPVCIPKTLQLNAEAKINGLNANCSTKSPIDDDDDVEIIEPTVIPDSLSQKSNPSDVSGKFRSMRPSEEKNAVIPSKEELFEIIKNASMLRSVTSNLSKNKPNFQNSSVKNIPGNGKKLPEIEVITLNDDEITAPFTPSIVNSTQLMPKTEPDSLFKGTELTKVKKRSSDQHSDTCGERPKQMGKKSADVINFQQKNTDNSFSRCDTSKIVTRNTAKKTGELKECSSRIKVLNSCEDLLSSATMKSYLISKKRNISHAIGNEAKKMKPTSSVVADTQVSSSTHMSVSPHNGSSVHKNVMHPRASIGGNKFKASANPNEKNRAVIFCERRKNRSSLSNSLHKNVGKHFIGIDDLPSLILEWNASWLLTQKETKKCAPICDAYASVKDTYKNELDYYNTYFPLHLLSIWLRISNSWKSPEREKFLGVCENQVEKPNFVKVMCSTVLSMSDFSNWPKKEDILLCRATKSNGNVEELFGRVCNVKAKDYNPPANSSLQGKADVLKRVRFEFFSAQALESPVTTVQIQILCNIRIALLQNDALQHLNNALKELLLDPKKHRSRLSFHVLRPHSDPTYSKCIKAIVDSTMYPKFLVTLVDTSSSSDVVFAISQLAVGLKRHSPVLIGLRSENALLRLANNLKHCNLILAVKKKDVKLPDELKQFTLEERLTVLTGREILSKWHVTLTLLSNIFLGDLTDFFAEQNLTCILDEAHLCTEAETALLLSYDVKNLVLMGNRKGEPDMHPILKRFGYNISLFSRLSKAK